MGRGATRMCNDRGATTVVQQAAGLKFPGEGKLKHKAPDSKLCQKFLQKFIPELFFFPG
jgi:hypothetical protein